MNIEQDRQTKLWSLHAKIGHKRFQRSLSTTDIDEAQLRAPMVMEEILRDEIARLETIIARRLPTARAYSTTPEQRKAIRKLIAANRDKIKKLYAHLERLGTGEPTERDVFIRYKVRIVTDDGTIEQSSILTNKYYAYDVARKMVDRLTEEQRLSGERLRSINTFLEHANRDK